MGGCETVLARGQPAHGRAWPAPLLFAAATAACVGRLRPTACGAAAAAAGTGVPPELARLGLPDDFFSEYFGKKWLHLPADAGQPAAGSGGRRFKDLWGRRQAARASASNFRAVSSGVEHPWIHIPGNRGGDRMVDARVAWRLNMTLVHDGAEERHAPLAAFLFHVCAFFGLYVRANSYMTPPRHVQGFEYHTDGHDFFVLQVGWPGSSRTPRVSWRAGAHIADC
eukprot:SAG31_NODE_4450_length_3221_cov_2.819987_3_plen_225_part_00